MTHEPLSSPIGPGQPFEHLIGASTTAPAQLPAAWRAIFGGDWQMPAFAARPYVYSNLAASRDGRMSFATPGADNSGVVTAANPHDRWLMGLLRARADAVMMGDTTVKIERGILGSAAYVCDYEAAAYASLRQHENRRPNPLMVIVSYDCAFDPAEACFQDAASHIVIATTAHGSARGRALRGAAQIDVHELGADLVDLRELVRMLYSTYGVRALLCEGGPRVMGGMLAAQLIDEEFLTYCPVIVGASREHPRPSYVEGNAFMPQNAPLSRIQALRRAGDYLFLHTRVDYRTHTNG